MFGHVVARFTNDFQVANDRIASLLIGHEAVDRHAGRLVLNAINGL